MCTLTFQIGVHIRLFIFRKSAALYDTIRVYTFIRFVANPPYTIFIWSMFISSPILWIITSRVGSLLPFYRPAACLEAHPAGVPGNCHLPASLSLGPHWAPDTRKLLLTKCLRICDKVTKGYIWSTTTLYAIGPTAFAWLIHNSSVCLGGCFGRSTNKYSSKWAISCSSSCLPFAGVRMVICHSALYGYVCYYLMQSIGSCGNFCFILFNH